jgi:hypothetical protein
MADNFLSSDINIINGDNASSVKKDGEFVDELNNKTVDNVIAMSDEWTNNTISTDDVTKIGSVTTGELHNPEASFVIKEGETEAKSKYVYDDATGTLTFKDETIAKTNEFGCIYAKSDEVPLNDMVRDLEILSAFNRIPDFGAIYDVQVRQITMGRYKYANALLCVNLAKSLGYLSLDKIINDEYITKKGMNDLNEKYKDDKELAEKFPPYSGWLDSEEYINTGWVDIDELIKKALKDEFAYDTDWSLSIRTKQFADRKRALVYLILNYTSNIWGLNSSNKIVDFGLRVIDKTSGKQLDFTDIKNGLRDAVGQTAMAQFVGELGAASTDTDGNLSSGQPATNDECVEKKCDKNYVSKCDGTIFKKDCSSTTDSGSVEDKESGNFHLLSPQFKINQLSNYRKDKPDILNTIDPIHWTTGNIDFIKEDYPDAYKWIEEILDVYGEPTYESMPLNQNRGFHYVGGTFEDGIAAGGLYHQNDVTLAKEFWGTADTYEIWNGTSWRMAGNMPISRGLGLAGGSSNYHVEAWGVKPLWSVYEGDINNDKVAPYAFNTDGKSKFYEYNNSTWSYIDLDPLIEKHSVSGIISASKTGNDASAVTNEDFSKKQLPNSTECIEACSSNIAEYISFLGNSAGEVSYKNIFSGFCFNGTRGPVLLDSRNYCDDFDDNIIFFSYINAVRSKTADEIKTSPTPPTVAITTKCSFADPNKKYPVKTIGTCYVGSGTAGIATGGKTCIPITSCDGMDARANKYKRYFDADNYYEQYDSIVKYAYEWNGTSWTRREDMPEDVAFHCGVGDEKWSMYWGGLHSSVERASVALFVPGCDTWYDTMEAFNGAFNKYGLCGLSGEIKYAEFANTFLDVLETGTNVYRVPSSNEAKTSKYYPVIEVAASCSSKFIIDISTGVNSNVDDCPAGATSLLGARPEWGIKSRYIGNVENQIISATVSIAKAGSITPPTSSDPGIGIYLGVYDPTTGKYVLASYFEWDSQMWLNNYSGGLATINIDPSVSQFLITSLVDDSYEYDHFICNVVEFACPFTCQEFNLSSTFPTLNLGDPGYPSPGDLYPASLVIGPYAYDTIVKSGKCDGSSSMSADDQFVLDGVNSAASYAGGTTLINLPAGNSYTIQVRNLIDTATGANGRVSVFCNDYVDTYLNIYDEINSISAAPISGNYTIYEYNDYGGFYTSFGSRGHYKQTTVPTMSGDMMFVTTYESGTTVLVDPISGDTECVCQICISGQDISASNATMQYDEDALATAVNTDWVGSSITVPTEIYNYRYTNVCNLILNNYHKNSPSEGGTLITSTTGFSNWIWSVPVKLVGDEDVDTFFIKRSPVVLPSNLGCEVIKSTTRDGRAVVSRAIVAGPGSNGIGMNGFGKCDIADVSGSPFNGFFDYQEVGQPMPYADAVKVFPWVVIGDEGTVGPRGCADMFDADGNYWFAVGDANNKKSTEMLDTDEQVNTYTIVMITPDKFDEFNTLVVAKTNLKSSLSSIGGFNIAKPYIEADALTGLYATNKTARNREGLLEAINAYNGENIFEVYVKLFEYIVPDIATEDNAFILDSISAVTSGGDYGLPYFASTASEIENVENYNIITSKDISCLNCYTCGGDEITKYAGKNWIQHYHEEWAAPYIQHPLSGVFSRSGFNVWVTAGDCPQRWGTAVWTSVDNGRVWVNYKRSRMAVNESRNHLIYSVITSSFAIDNYAEEATSDIPVINKYDEFIFNLSDYADDAFVMGLIDSETKDKVCDEQTSAFVPQSIWSECVRGCQNFEIFTNPSCSASCDDVYLDKETGCISGYNVYQPNYASEDFDPDIGYTEWATNFVMEYKRPVLVDQQGEERYYYKYNVDEIGSNCLKDREGINDQSIDTTSWRRFQDGVGLGGDAPLFNRPGTAFACNNTMVNFIGQKAFGNPDRAIICGGYAVEATGELSFNHWMWNAFTQGPTFKWNRFVINPEDTVNKNYTYRNLSPFYSNGDQTLVDSVHGSIVFDVSGPATVERYGQAVFNNTNEETVEFDTFPSFITNKDKYSISLTPSDNVKVWWESKGDGTFIIKCEIEKWKGTVDWRVMYIEEIPVDQIDGQDPQKTFDGYEDK